MLVLTFTNPVGQQVVLFGSVALYAFFNGQSAMKGVESLRNSNRTTVRWKTAVSHIGAIVWTVGVATSQSTTCSCAAVYSSNFIRPTDTVNVDDFSLGMVRRGATRVGLGLVAFQRTTTRPGFRIIIHW